MPFMGICRGLPPWYGHNKTFPDALGVADTAQMHLCGAGDAIGTLFATFVTRWRDTDVKEQYLSALHALPV